MNKGKKTKRTTKKMFGRGKETKHRSIITGSKSIKKFPPNIRNRIIKKNANYNDVDNEQPIDPISYEPIDAENDIIVINGDKVYLKETFRPYINQKLDLDLNFPIGIIVTNNHLNNILQKLFVVPKEIRDTYENPLDIVSKISILLEIYANLYPEELIYQFNYLLLQSKILKNYYENNRPRFNEMAKMIANEFIDKDNYVGKINIWNYYIAGAISQLKYTLANESQTQLIPIIESHSIDTQIQYIDTNSGYGYVNKNKYIEVCNKIRSNAEKVYTAINAQNNDLKSILYPVIETLQTAIQKQKINLDYTIKNDKFKEYTDDIPVFMNGGINVRSQKCKNRKTHKLYCFRE